MTTTAKHELYTILDKIGKNLDITDTQYKLAVDRYTTIGKWLADGEYCLVNKKICLKNGEIYPQGSIKLQTTVKPIGQEEFDVDLVFFTPNVSTTDIEPTELNRLIGDRLREHKTYKNMLEPLKRGWRITYADEFHLDITPSINNEIEIYNSSELVPDRKIQDWKPSNPKDYATWFDDISTITPSFNRINALDAAFESKAHSVVDLPNNDNNKPLLKRYIQILKRHRDVMFQEKSNKPISIIITTLATKAYAYCVKTNKYDNELDLLSDVIKYMPAFIDDSLGVYKVLNPKTISENFAERWNEVPAKKKAFDTWHSNATNFFDSLYNVTGQHKIFESLKQGFGKKPVTVVSNDMTNQVLDNRNNGLLSLGLLSSSDDTYAMKKNTFFGN